MTRRVFGSGWSALVLLGGGCGGGGGTGPGSPSATLAKAAPSGDGQSAPAGTQLPEPLRVVVTENGAPVAGRTVVWAILAQGGSVSPQAGATGADGIATTSVTLPPFAATSAVTAASSGTSGSPLRFSVTSTGATSFVTVEVADNEFQPDNFQLKAGGSVTFVWQNGAGPHNVTPVAPNTIPASTNPAPPGTHLAPFSFDASFPTAGSFTFFCGVHGTPTSGMRGSVTVVP